MNILGLLDPDFRCRVTLSQRGDGGFSPEKDRVLFGFTFDLLRKLLSSLPINRDEGSVSEPGISHRIA